MTREALIDQAVRNVKDGAHVYRWTDFLYMARWGSRATKRNLKARVATQFRRLSQTEGKG